MMMRYAAMPRSFAGLAFLAARAEAGGKNKEGSLLMEMLIPSAVFASWWLVYFC
jgi:hypothetical protein